MATSAGSKTDPHRELLLDTRAEGRLIERFFKELTDRRLRRGVFSSVPDLVRAMQTWIAARNADPKPFTWTAAAEEIIDKVKRGRTSLSRLTSPKTPTPQATSLTQH